MPSPDLEGKWCDFCDEELATAQTKDGVNLGPKCQDELLKTMERLARQAQYEKARKARPRQGVGSAAAKARARRRRKRKMTKR